MPTTKSESRSSRPSHLWWFGFGAAMFTVAAFGAVRARQSGDATAAGLGDVWRSGRRRTTESPVRVVEAVTINEPMERVQQRWHSLGAELPESLHLSEMGTSGGEGRPWVRFTPAPGGRGTEVRVEFERQPRGPVSAAVMRWLGGDPTGQLRQDLRRFKQLVETGEVLLSEGPSLWRPGQPAASPDDIRRASRLEV